MNLLFPRSSQSLAMVLAVSLTLGTTGLAHADLMNKVNPMSWFSGGDEVTQPTKTSIKAQKQALEAQVQAEQALKAAQEALQKAEQIKKQADELQEKAQQQAETKQKKRAEKPVVKAPDEYQATKIEAPATPKATKASRSERAEHTETVSEEASEKNGWHTLKLFTKKDKDAAEQTRQADIPVSHQKASTLQPLVTPATESVPTAQETPHATSAPWNPMTWFSKAATEGATANAMAEETTEPVTQPAPVTSGEVNLKTKAAVMETEKGNITFELYPDYAPNTVNNFAKLIGDGFYNRYNMKFHRVVPGFVIQTGDPTGTGAGGSKERIPLESKNKLSHNAKGIVAMARGADPNSATSQFYITLTPQTSLDGKYTIFGKVIAGLDVLEKIEKNDMLYGIRLVDLDSVVRDSTPDKKRFFSSVF